MTPERWAEVGRLFDAAQGLTREGRTEFLERECPGDADMRAEVKSLLASLDGAESFLEHPVAEPLRSPLPRGVGSYEIVGKIGHGGMGVVYKAVRRDQGFERLFAVKLVKRGTDTDFILRRFDSERRILAGLDHPNIARVLDGGSTEDALPYFVMELIEGKNVLEYCDEKRLGIAERLALFQRVCSAVQYAHQRLVIHRDIKPGNILVTAEGVPKLLDFGLAKILAVEEEAVDRTETALRLLTPEYASPEQVRGQELTTASDVYSLGVVLYELLTGERPYRLRTRTSEEISGAVLNQEPEKPSSRAPLHRDLDAVVMMALRKEPARRYAPAEQARYGGWSAGRRFACGRHGHLPVADACGPLRAQPGAGRGDPGAGDGALSGGPLPGGKPGRGAGQDSDRPRTAGSRHRAHRARPRRPAGDPSFPAGGHCRRL